MLPRFAVLIGLVLPVGHLEAQIGLASGTARILLSATKPASVRVSLAGSDPSSVTVTTTWELESIRTSTVVLVAYVDRGARDSRTGTDLVSARRPTGRVRAGGPQRYVAGRLFSGTLQPTTGESVVKPETVRGNTAVGHRTDQVQVRVDPTEDAESPTATPAGTLNLLAITQ
jgi:hypothetical protein